MITIKVGDSEFQTGQQVAEFMADMFPKGTKEPVRYLVEGEIDWVVYAPDAKAPVVEDAPKPAAKKGKKNAVEE